MKNLLKIVAVLGVALLLSAVALGQAISGDLNGVVKDQSGAVVANATVEVTNLGTAFKQTAKTNTSGEYHFANLPAGHYSVQASAAGLKGGFADIEITLNKTSTANITTNVAGTATTVEVSEAAATIDTTTPTIGTTFETHEIADSPTTSTGSGVLNLSLLNAGVASTGGIGVGSGPSVSGQRPRNNNFTVEGVDNNSISVTGPLITIPNDAVDNFTVLQNQFSPEFGHSSGGQFNQTIKSGSNQFHGKAYEYFQNRNLNAVDSQYALSQGGGNVSNPRYDSNRFGGSIGGPILKNKLFFFTDWEYNPVGLSGTPSTACAPTAAGYSQLAALFPNNNQLQTMQKYLPAGGSTATTCPTVAGVGPAIQVVPGLPTNLWGTNTTIYNIPVGDVGFSGPSYSNTLTTANSFDWNISQNDQLRGRLAYSKFDGFDTAAQLPSFWDTIPARYWVVTLSEYHNFSPNINNEFRVGFNRYSQIYPTGSQTYPGLNVFPNLQIYELNGVQLGPDPNAPQTGIQNLYQGVDNLSWSKGRHNFRFGAEFRWYISPQTFTQRVRGDYEWQATSDFLNDSYPNPNNGDFAERSAGDVVYYGNRKAFYTYANDEFRVTPKLTLNYGIRYEWTGEPLAATQLQPLNSISNVPGLITFGAPTTQKTNFMPRVGIAYALESNTSIRAGFAMANDVLFDNLGLLSLPPQVQQTCDTLPVSVGNDPRTPGCTWSLGGFLANGGLPSVPLPITDAAAARSVTSAYIPNQQLPYSESWNVGVQHMFANKYTLEVRYVGTKGIHLPVQTRINRTSPIGPDSYLPTYLAAPSQATLDSLPYTVKCPATGCGGLTNLAANNPSYFPAYLNAGFTGGVVGFMPYGASNYNGLQTQFSRSFSNGLQFQAAWTWSHMFDNSTAEVFSTVLTPRRPQNFSCIACDWGTSAYDRRHRVTIQVLYDLPFYKNSSNWMMKNIVGNWQFTPIYTFQSPEYATVQSGVDSNLNGDSAPDRAIYNPAGIAGTGSGVTALKNTIGDTVAYLANNPTAQYIVAGSGALATSAKNTLATPHINNWDFSIIKRVNITERQALEFNFQATNIFNHAQYVPGYISDVAPIGYTSGEVTNLLRPTAATFNNPQAVFSNHPRNVVLVLKYIF